MSKHKDLNIYCKAGTTVKFHARNKDDWEKNFFLFENTYLKDGEIYTVERTVVHGWSTDVYLMEVKGKGFNSVCFEEIKDED